jgi:hypothetical protein
LQLSWCHLSYFCWHFSLPCPKICVQRKQSTWQSSTCLFQLHVACWFPCLYWYGGQGRAITIFFSAIVVVTAQVADCILSACRQTWI